MQIKMSLDGIPSDRDKIRSIINSATGLLVHEIGHVVASAKQGFPSDLIIIPKDISAHEGMSYIDGKFKKIMEVNPSRHKSCLAGGFMAEHKIFFEPALHRSLSDILRMAKIDKKSIVCNADVKSYVEGFIDSQSDFFGIKDTINIKSIYRKIANFIRGNDKPIEGFYIIPMRIWFDNIHDKTDEDAIEALSRSNDENRWHDFVRQIKNKN